MKNIRIALWALVAIFAGISGYVWLGQSNKAELEQVAAVKIGGPFDLIKHDGSKITQDDIVGRDHAIFFGFTHCPDICPTTLMQTAGWLKELGEDSEKLDFYFFSVDPERDTPEILSQYVNAFDPRITGVTGDIQEMEKTIKSYKVYSKRVELDDDDYTMDHAAYVLMFRAGGNFIGTISFDESQDTAIAKLRRLIKKS